MISDFELLGEPQAHQPQFSLGDVFVSFAALRKIPQETLLDCLERHAAGEGRDPQWSPRVGQRLNSTFHVNGQTLSIITDADRTQTRMLLAEEEPR